MEYEKQGLTDQKANLRIIQVKNVNVNHQFKI